MVPLRDCTLEHGAMRGKWTSRNCIQLNCMWDFTHGITPDWNFTKGFAPIRDSTHRIAPIYGIPPNSIDVLYYLATSWPGAWDLCFKKVGDFLDSD